MAHIGEELTLQSIGLFRFFLHRNNFKFALDIESDVARKHHDPTNRSVGFVPGTHLPP